MKAMKQFLIAIAFFTCSLTQAQVQVNVNIGTPPAWGPAGYAETRYYYLPDIYTYYDVSTGHYIYLRKGKWTRATVLPVAYRNYNLYNGYKVVLHNYRGATPYIYYKTHKVKYPKGYKGKPQKTIGMPPGHVKKVVAAPHSRGNVEVAKVKKPSHGHAHKHKGKGKGKD